MPQLGPDHERNDFSVPLQSKPHMKRGNAFRRAAACTLKIREVLSCPLSAGYFYKTMLATMCAMERTILYIMVEMWFVSFPFGTYSDLLTTSEFY